MQKKPVEVIEINYKENDQVTRTQQVLTPITSFYL